MQTGLQTGLATRQRTCYPLWRPVAIPREHTRAHPTGTPGTMCTFIKPLADPVPTTWAPPARAELSPPPTLHLKFFENQMCLLRHQSTGATAPSSFEREHCVPNTLGTHFTDTSWGLITALSAGETLKALHSDGRGQVISSGKR